MPWRVAFARNWCCEPARVLDALGRGGRPGLAGSTRTKTRLPRCVRVSMDSCLAPASISQHCRANGARSGADPQLQDEKERVTFASWGKTPPPPPPHINNNARQLISLAVPPGTPDSPRPQTSISRSLRRRQFRRSSLSPTHLHRRDIPPLFRLHSAVPLISARPSFRSLTTHNKRVELFLPQRLSLQSLHQR